MDVLRLDKTTFLPDVMIEGYSSMIWTERHIDAGEFQMKTPNVAQMRDLIPEDSLITLRDTNEVMLVETHSIDKNEDDIPESTITGRTLEVFTENRDFTTSLRSSFSNGDYFIRTLTSAEQVEYFLWNDIVGNPSNTPSPNWIPGFVVTDSVTKTEDRIYYEVPQTGDVYTKILELLKKGKHGIRVVRPNSEQATVVSFDGNGNPIRNVLPTDALLRFDVYDGVDRSRNQVTNTPVILSYEAGDIVDPKYLFSVKGYRNVADVKVDPVAEPSENRLYYIDGASEATTGLARRVLSVDATDIKYSADPSYDAALQARALSELAKNNRTMFDGEISLLAHYKYGVDYFLGDLVSLSAEYGVEQIMQVTEYVRTEDQSGDRGYPTLVLSE